MSEQAVLMIVGALCGALGSAVGMVLGYLLNRGLQRQLDRANMAILALSEKPSAVQVGIERLLADDAPIVPQPSYADDTQGMVGG